jgi:hypothetical protein
VSRHKQTTNNKHKLQSEASVLPSHQSPIGMIEFNRPEHSKRKTGSSSSSTISSSSSSSSSSSFGSIVNAQRAPAGYVQTPMYLQITDANSTECKYEVPLNITGGLSDNWCGWGG